MGLKIDVETLGPTRIDFDLAKNERTYKFEVWRLAL